MTDRLDIERALLAAVLRGGASALLVLRRTPWSPAWFTGSRRYAVEAAEAIVGRGEAPGPIGPDAIAAEIRRRPGAGTIRAEAARFEAEAAIEARNGEIMRLAEQLGRAAWDVAWDAAGWHMRRYR